MDDNDLDILLTDLEDSDKSSEKKDQDPGSTNQENQISDVEKEFIDSQEKPKSNDSIPDPLSEPGIESEESQMILGDLPDIKEPKISEIPIQYDIKRFDTSLNEPLKSHIYAADSAINIIAEANLTWDQQKVFDLKRKDLVGIFEQIIHLHDKFYFALSKKNLIKEAERGYYAHFEGPQNKSNTEFLILRESYQALKSYNIQLKNHWDKANSILVDLGQNSEIKKFIRKLLQDKVEPMLLICQQTDELIHRIKVLLNIKDEKIDKFSFSVHVKAKHDPNKKYNIVECFTGQIAKDRENEINKKKLFDKMEDETRLHDPVKNETVSKEDIKEKHGLGTIKLGSVKDFSLDRVEKKIEDSKAAKEWQGSTGRNLERDLIELELVGKKLWNQSKFYQLSYSKSKIMKIDKKINSAVYFTDKPHINDESYIRKKIIIGIARKNRMNIVKDLRDFLFAEVANTIDEIIIYFGIPANFKLLFTFHLGAGQLSQVQRKYIIINKLAICYISIPGVKNNKIIKEFYAELIDESIRIFWETRINPSYDESFDNFWEFSKIADMVRNKYYHELEVNRRRLDSIFEKMNLTKATAAQKEKYFQDHFVDWFGLKNIYVYKRFIERSIFTQWEFQPPKF